MDPDPPVPAIPRPPLQHASDRVPAQSPPNRMDQHERAVPDPLFEDLRGPDVRHQLDPQLVLPDHRGHAGHDPTDLWWQLAEGFTGNHPEQLASGLAAAILRLARL